MRLQHLLINEAPHEALIAMQCTNGLAIASHCDDMVSACRSAAALYMRRRLSGWGGWDVHAGLQAVRGICACAVPSLGGRRP